jgi:hypothetical protein
VTEATEAPATESSPESPENTEAAIAALRRQLEGHVSVSASVVQDGLLDLWAHLPEGESRAIVERWLTETLERNLYAVTDVDSRLETVLSRQG